MKNIKTFTFKEVILIVCVTSLIMCLLGGIIIYKNFNINNDKSLRKFTLAYESLVNNYYDELNSEELIEAAISSMYEKVDDPYTLYMNEESSDNLNEQLEGSYEGLGVGIIQDDSGSITIVDVYEDTPASKAGIEPGDIVLSVDNNSAVGLTTEDVVALIKNSKVKEHTMKCLRNEEEIDVQFTLEKIMSPAVSSKILEKNNKKVGYLNISVFNDTVDIQFKKALQKLENEGIDSLIIDVRGNTGGYLKNASRIAELFLSKGQTIYSLRSKNSTKKYNDSTKENRNYKIGVLIDRRSASASEVLAAALKYSYGATLAGTNSYGKGKVQEVANVTNKTTVKYTTAEWLTPNGDCIDKVGLKPDIEVEFSYEDYNSTNPYTDNQITTLLDNLTR